MYIIFVCYASWSSPQAPRQLCPEGDFDGYIQRWAEIENCDLKNAYVACHETRYEWFEQTLAAVQKRRTNTSHMSLELAIAALYQFEQLAFNSGHILIWTRWEDYDDALTALFGDR